MKLLITGVTGFLGSHIAKLLVNLEYEIVALKRNTSDISKLAFFDRITWYDIDDDDWIPRVTDFAPDIIIHTAWIGVDNDSRDNWQNQLSNVSLINNLLEVARLSRTRKFIALGSQAEYGMFKGKISEYNDVNPVTAYAAVKCVMQKIIQSFCELHSIEWIWLRVFSIFGERESSKWLIPNTIFKLLNGENDIPFTEGKQKYAYLYVRDFAHAVNAVICSSINNSGIYNISSTVPVELRYILTTIRDIINPKANLAFGSLPYRQNQSMHIEGDMTKFNKAFGNIEESDINQALKDVVHFYKEQKNESI